MFIKQYTLWERHTGICHTIGINYSFGRYEVRYDDEFYTTVENMVQATDEAVDIVINNNLTNIRPF